MKNIFKSRLRIALLTIIAFALWTLIVCYPNPYIFIRNFARYLNYPVDPSIVELINEPIPEEPQQIDKFVDKIIKYEYDWINYGVPWYVPEPKDAVIRGKGDCESRAMVLASIFSAKGIPYSLKASLVHIWVEYADKKQNSAENDEVSFIGKVDGKYRLRLPDLSQWKHYIDVEKKMLWDAMPTYRKAFMLSGWGAICLINAFLFIFFRKKEK
jgi:hypothetical protein